MEPNQPILVPLITAFTDDTTTVSEVRIARLIRFYRETGAAGFVVCSEVGDHLTLSHNERKDVVEIVLREAVGMPVYVNVTGFTTASMLDLAQHADRHGSRGSLFKPPVSLGLTEEESKSLVTALRRYTNQPVSLIDHPDRVDAVMKGADQRLLARPLIDSALGEYAICPVPVACEIECPDGICTPLAILGVDRARVIFSKWTAAKPVAEGLIKMAGPQRFARAATAMLPYELGTCRTPVKALNEGGIGVMRKLFAAGNPYVEAEKP